MAPITLYDATVNAYIRVFNLLQLLLQRAQEHAPEESSTYPSARLYDDMLPLSAQVQIASRTVRAFVDRVAPHRARDEGWADADSQPTMGDLRLLVDRTLALLETVRPEDVEGRDQAFLEIPMGGGNEFRGIASDAALGLLLPNLFFHAVTAYDILRHKGVPLGKRDYLTSFVAGYHVPRE